MAKAIYDYNGTTATQNKKIYDYNGTTATQLKKGYDWNGTAATPVYTSFDGTLYNAGDQCTDETGGWTNNAGGTTKDCVRYISYTSSYMQLSVDNYNGWDSMIYATVQTANPIDVTAYSTMHVQWSYDSDKSGSSKYPYVEFYMGSSSAKPLQNGSSISSANNHAKTTTTIDISSLTGLQRPRLRVWDLYSDTNLVVRIYKVWLT